jgi:hypothetical protein
MLILPPRAVGRQGDGRRTQPCPIAPEDFATTTLHSTSNPAVDPGCRSWVSLTRSPLASTIRTHDRLETSPFWRRIRIATRKW